ncbi:hypothetical protein TNCV_4384011 [Trichonephila clavipes]|nr:hypothetical protein TNCV_4384011 [Trichonephila clavipes]
MMADKDLLEAYRSSKNIIEADCGDENEVNIVALVPTSSEVSNIMTRGIFSGTRTRTYDILNGRGSRMVKVSDRGWLVTSSSPVPLKTRRVRQRCTLNLSRTQTSSR